MHLLPGRCASVLAALPAAWFVAHWGSVTRQPQIVVIFGILLPKVLFASTHVSLVLCAKFPSKWVLLCSGREAKPPHGDFE